MFTLLTTWKRGRSILFDRLSQETMPLDIFITSIAANPPHRVPGTAVFLTTTEARVPHALLHNLKHNKVLHDRVVLLTIKTHEVPSVPLAERLRIRDLGCNFQQMEAYFGFKEDVGIYLVMLGFLIVGAWVAYRVIRGWLRLRAHQSMPVAAVLAPGA